MTTYDKVKQEWEQAQSQIADMRARLLDDIRQHEEAIKRSRALLDAMPGTKVAKPAKTPSAPEAAAVEDKGPTIAEAIVAHVAAYPGVSVADTATALPTLKRKSVENTFSMLVSKGRLVKDGKGYAVAAA